MRILQLIADGDRGGAQRHVWDLISAMVPSEAVLVTGRCGWLTEQATSAGVVVHVLPGLSRTAPSIDLRAAVVSLRDLLGKAEVEAMHAHGAKALLTAKAAVSESDLPIIATSHGLAAFDPTRPLAQRVLLQTAERWRRHRIAAFIGVSRQECRLAARLGMPPERIHLIPNGVPIRPSPEHHEGFVRHLAFAGRLVAEKGVRLLPQLAVALPPGATLHVAGDGPLAGWLERQAKGSAIAGRLQLEGWVESLPGWLAKMDALVLPSAKEGLPYALLEAAERALPIVAFDVGGVGDLLAEGVSGRVVPAGQNGAFISAVRDLCQQRTRQWAWGRRARAAVSERFTVEEMQRATLALYRQILDKGAH